MSMHTEQIHDKYISLREINGPAQQIHLRQLLNSDVTTRHCFFTATNLDQCIYGCVCAEGSEISKLVKVTYQYSVMTCQFSGKSYKTNL